MKGTFIESSHTWELKYGRKTPILDHSDRIARYGSGFSKLLAIAGTPQDDRINMHSRMSATTLTQLDESIMIPEITGEHLNLD